MFVIRLRERIKAEGERQEQIKLVGLFYWFNWFHWFNLLDWFDWLDWLAKGESEEKAQGKGHLVSGYSDSP